MATPRKNSIGEDGKPEYIAKLHAPVEIGEINTIEHTARIFGVSVAIVAKLQKDGQLAGTHVSARYVTFSRASILDFIDRTTDRIPHDTAGGAS
jgi:hypothetical protein